MMRSKQALMIGMIAMIGWLMVACGGSSAEIIPTEQPAPTATIAATATAVATPEPAAQLVGMWSGKLQTQSGWVYPSEWVFEEDGSLLLTVVTDEGTVNLAYDYYFDEEGALRMDAGDGEEPGRREVFFENMDTVRLVAVRDGIVTLLLRGPLVLEPTAEPVVDPQSG